MYERFRNEFASKLSDIYSAAEIDRILSHFDSISVGYDFLRKQTDLVPYNRDEIPPLVKLYIGCKKSEGLSDQSLYGYLKILEIFFSWLPKEPSVIRSDEIRVYLYTYQQQTGVSNRTLDKYRAIIAGFFNWCHSEGYIAHNPAAKLKPIKHDKRPRQALSQIELEYIRKACKTPRDTAIIEVLYSTACRVSELANIRMSDINWETKTIHILGKGQKHRTSFINAKAEIAIRSYLATRKGDSAFLFVSTRAPYGQISRFAVEKIVRVIAGRASDSVHKPVTPHVFRHTSATTAMNNGMPVEDISKFLGHSKLETTMIYAHTSTEAVHANHKKYVV